MRRVNGGGSRAARRMGGDSRATGNEIWNEMWNPSLSIMDLTNQSWLCHRRLAQAGSYGLRPAAYGTPGVYGVYGR